MDIIKKPYEISLWEDILTFVYEDGAESESAIENGHKSVVAQYYKERKICIIGSDTMDTPIRATQGKLVSKVNGENILTFNMYSHYYDNENEEYYINPFIGLLVNERKVKLRYGALGAPDTKWYDFVIKNIQENSDTKMYSYTAKDIYVNELSKSGFNLEFNQELENNMGNIEYLGEIILEESDWELKRTGKVLKQTLEEPLYYLQLNRDIVLRDMESNKPDLELEAGDFVYAFYSSLTNEEKFVQFLYANTYEIDDDHIITNSPNWYLDEVTYSNGIPDFTDSLSISSEYRGKRLVRKVKTAYDATIDKYVNVYDNGAIYGFTETEYLSPATVRSYVTNANSYDSYIGWDKGANANGSFPDLSVISVPDVRDVDASKILDGSQTFVSCLEFKTSDSSQLLYNSGIVDMRQHINGFTAGEEYVFRIKYGELLEAKNGRPYRLKDTNISLSLRISQYEINENGQYIPGTTYFEYTFTPSGSNSTTRYYDSLSRNDEGEIIGAVVCQASLSYAQMVEMSNSLGLFIQNNTPEKTVYIEDVQFFPFVKTSSGGYLLPDGISESEIKTKYYYYIPNSEYKQIEEVQFVYEGYEPNPAYEEDYNENSYEKIRSITASESNRFNLIQELCEIFECWPKFEIEHNSETGEILLGKDRKDENGNPIECSEEEKYRQQKWISFHEYIGQDNYAGFKYGINLKSIQRTIESEGIVSKLIVKNNSNEFATDGFCSIARATESPNGENFILDFSYYIQQGMLGLAEFTNDLYFDKDNPQGYIGYYKQLKRINTKRDQYIKEQSGLLGDIAEYSASLQTYNISCSEASKQKQDKLSYLERLTGYTFSDLINNQENNSDNSNTQIVEWWENDQVISTMASIGRLSSVIKNHQALANKISGEEGNLTIAQARYDQLDRILTSREEATDGEERLLLEKEALHRAFYKKYSRFLQEGSWISEDYIDDNLYFLDAQSTLNTSAKPKITYNISVLELSQLEGYENYNFALGDKTTIEDTEFFGWTWIEGVQTPYKEEIVVTELTAMLDSPEQNQIKVQNYKTQFEDLFQRMAATTQSVEYSTGSYQKVAGIIETDGTINITTLQNSIANNALTLQNANDQSVVWDETGITTTSLNNPAEIVRIVSGGVFLSVDGGITWNTGITGKGINASYITSGQMNVEQVNILNGSFPSFRWDNTGLSAYEFSLNKDTGKPNSFNFSKFVRLDQYGLYGINGYSNFNSAEADDAGTVGEEKVWKYSNFALTWKGFQIKSNATRGGYVSITSENDFQVYSAPEKEQIKIGLLYDEAEVVSRDGENKKVPLYGIRIKDWEGYTVMEQSSDGKMWIRDELQIGTGASAVSIGYLANTKAITSEELKIIYRNEIGEEINKEDLSKVHQVFNAANKFIVHEDGSMVATDGYFKGTIIATGGRIGNMEITQLVDPGYEVSIEIEEGSGTIFENDNEVKTLVANLYHNGQLVVNETNLKYQWYKNNQKIEDENATNKKYPVSENDVLSSVEFSCQITKE